MYQLSLSTAKRKSGRVRKSMNTIGAVSGLISGLILMLTGIMLSLISFIEHKSFHGAEVIILCLGFGFLILGTHCLDRTEIEKAKRLKDSN